MKQTHGDKTRLKILDAGLQIWPNITVQSVAKVVGFQSHTPVLYHFKTVDDLKNAVARHAVEKGNSRVIVQLCAINHPAVQFLTPAARTKHFKAV